MGLFIDVNECLNLTYGGGCRHRFKRRTFCAIFKTSALKDLRRRLRADADYLSFRPGTMEMTPGRIRVQIRTIDSRKACEIGDGHFACLRMLGLRIWTGYVGEKHILTALLERGGDSAKPK
jgi:hypothetical protein